MARKKVFGFNKKQDFIRTRNAVRKLEGMQRTGARYRNEFPTGGGTGGSEVRVKIKSIDDSTTPISATARIVGYDYGVGSAPKENDDREIIVHDHVGCNLVEPYDDLLCATGYARYMRNYATDEMQWELKSLDCEATCNIGCYANQGPIPADSDIIYISTGLFPRGIDCSSEICFWVEPNSLLRPGIIESLIEFLKSGKSVIIFGEVNNGDVCITQSECNKLNDFYHDIGGLATLVLDDLLTGCQAGGIVADDTHPFFLDGSGDQNVFFIGTGGSSQITLNGATALVYEYDSGSGTPTSNVIMAGNRYPAPGAGWVLLAGDTNMMDTCRDDGDLDVLFNNICRLQCLDELPDS